MWITPIGFVIESIKSILISQNNLFILVFSQDWP